MRRRGYSIRGMAVELNKAQAANTRAVAHGIHNSLSESWSGFEGEARP
jgi:hypothetical protein